MIFDNAFDATHRNNNKPGGHACRGDTSESNCGAAIGSCAEYKDGTLWAGHSEYLSQVSFCPYCGFKAEVPAVIIPYEVDDE